MRDLNLQLAGAQLGITMASLLLGFVAEPAVAGIIEDAVEAFFDVPSGVLHTISFVVALTIVAFLHMVIGEMVPKNVAIADPERTMLALAVPNRAYVTVFGPVLRVLNALSNAGVRALGVEPRDELATAASADELAMMLGASRDQGLIEEFAHQLLKGALDLGDRSIATVMVPREDIVWLPLTASPAEAEALVTSSGHTRLLVAGEGVDDLLGFVHAKDLLTLSGPARHRPPAARRSCGDMLVLGRRDLARRRPPRNAAGAASTWPWWRMPTGRPSASPPSRTSSRRWWATSVTKVTAEQGFRRRFVTCSQHLVRSPPVVPKRLTRAALALTVLLGLVVVAPRAGADAGDLAAARRRANAAAADLAEAETRLGELDAEIQSLEAEAATAQATLDSLRDSVRDAAVQQFINGDSSRYSYTNPDINTQARADALSKYATQGNQDAIDAYEAAAEDLQVAQDELAAKREQQKDAIAELEERRAALEREFERLEALERERQEAERRRREAAARAAPRRRGPARRASVPRARRAHRARRVRRAVPSPALRSAGSCAPCRARSPSATPGARPAPAVAPTRASTCSRRWAPPRSPP